MRRLRAIGLVGLLVLADLAGDTRDNDRLRVAVGGPWADLVAIRIETEESPSWVAWREIEVFGD